MAKAEASRYYENCVGMAIFGGNMPIRESRFDAELT